MFCEKKNDLLETLEKTAEDLLWRIHQVKSAISANDLDNAEAHLCQEAQALREQSGSLERYLRFEAEHNVYLGG